LIVVQIGGDSKYDFLYAGFQITRITSRMVPQIIPRKKRRYGNIELIC
jgi:hypothetical protein